MREWFTRFFLCYIRNIHDFGGGLITRDTTCKRCDKTLEELLQRMKPFDFTDWRF